MAECKNANSQWQIPIFCSFRFANSFCTLQALFFVVSVSSVATFEFGDEGGVRIWDRRSD